MINVDALRKLEPNILAIGSHPSIIQSMLDFDYLSSKQQPGVKAIIAAGRKFERYFFGDKEILIPVFSSITQVPEQIKQSVNLFFNTTSARRTKQTSIETLSYFPNMLGGTIFAEDVTEQHSISMYQYIATNNRFIIGPASVGLLIPGNLKIGAIGGTDYRQLVASNVMIPGAVAVLSASGGMVGEIIRIVAQEGKRISFSLSFGGDRFPILSPKEAFMAAQNDPQTKVIIYYGELGGIDEYDLAELLQSKQVTKQVICYVAGTVAELFDTPPQFGHAKAMAKVKGESAREKREALKKAGAHVPETFAEFVAMIKQIPEETHTTAEKYSTMSKTMETRKHAIITSSISSEKSGHVNILGEDLSSLTQNHSFAYIVSSLFLGKKIQSQEMEGFIDLVLRLAVDHGPLVSGAMNTIVTARAGKDLVSSLAAGLLTIGPRFGGATNEAAKIWLDGVLNKKQPYDLVEGFAKKKIYISGIGHRIHRVDFPDPRVTKLLAYTNNLHEKRFTTFAGNVEKITTSKKGNLILNVDGAIAAVLLDILSEKEHLSDQELQDLTDIEFFNALFVLSRSVGFLAHFLDQKRLGEGLFRLPEDLATDNYDNS